MAGHSKVLEAIIRLSQHTPFRNSHTSFTALQGTFVDQGPNVRTQSDHEAPYLDDLLTHFDIDLLDALRGKRVLDYGCGYGGKAVELARRLPESKVIGVEVHQHKIDKAEDFARRMGVTNAAFVLATQQGMPLPDGSVDAIVSHDVIEHVHDPASMMAELHRVLAPGGRAYLVFPPYEGAASHHLDFITLTPGLHWFFSAGTIMDTVNNILVTDYGKRFKSPPQPPPTYSPFARKDVLPSLNGLGTKTFLALAKPLFTVVRLSRISLLGKLTRLGLSPATARRLGKMSFLPPALAEYLTVSLVFILEKK
jgi:ubiquinone/menaquinone biosynthesis C-methylase UbiE